MSRWAALPMALDEKQRKWLEGMCRTRGGGRGGLAESRKLPAVGSVLAPRSCCPGHSDIPKHMVVPPQLDHWLQTGSRPQAELSAGPVPMATTTEDWSLTCASLARCVRTCVRRQDGQ